MSLYLDAACGSCMGKIRKNNEDNFSFGGNYLTSDDQEITTPLTLSYSVKNDLCLAVFDGMGGENFGEVASYTAAKQMAETKRKFLEYFIPTWDYLRKLTEALNSSIVKAKKQLLTTRCGTTMAALYFCFGSVFACNVGDSRIYRLRDGEFLQSSVDHVEKFLRFRQRKAPLTQHLGIDPEEIQIEPHIAKCKVRKGDKYLICSDGITDMLTNEEITEIMQTCSHAKLCVQRLMQAAMEKGGRDNITAIVCYISGTKRITDKEVEQ